MTRERPPALFFADALGLDFLNSIATPVDTPVDWIDNGAGLVAWIRAGGPRPREGARRATVARPPRRARQRGRPGSRPARVVSWVRRRAQGAAPRHLGSPRARSAQPAARARRSVPADRRARARRRAGLELRAARRWRSAESLLLPIGEALATCVCEEDFSDVKACEGPTCTLLFADHTRGRARRWCSMAICGNRAKVAAHRERRKAGR